MISTLNTKFKRWAREVRLPEYVRTYCVVDTKYLGVWLRFHPYFWGMWFFRGPRWGFTVQGLFLNIRVGESWNILNGGSCEYDGRWIEKE